MDETRECTVCHQPLPATREFFYARSDRPGGLQYVCKECNKAAYNHRRGRKEWRENARRWRAAHRDEWDAYMKEWVTKNADKNAAYTRNRAARLRKAPGHHTAADVQAQRARQKGCCYWCGARVGRRYHVDHVTALSKGGSNGPENIVIACPPCNWSKYNRSPQEFGRLC